MTERKLTKISVL